MIDDHGYNHLAIDTFFLDPTTCPSCGPCKPIDHQCPACHTILLPDDLRVCNCAACRCLLTGAGQEDDDSYPPVVHERIKGRPYCERCAREMYEDALTMDVKELAGSVRICEVGKNAIR